MKKENKKEVKVTNEKKEKISIIVPCYTKKGFCAVEAFPCFLGKQSLGYPAPKDSRRIAPACRAAFWINQRNCATGTAPASKGGMDTSCCPHTRQRTMPSHSVTYSASAISLPFTRKQSTGTLCSLRAIRRTLRRLRSAACKSSLLPIGRLLHKPAGTERVY